MKNTSKQEKQTLSRRDALKALIATAGAVAISTVPNKWETPLVEIGYLPAHAQASPTATPTPLPEPPLGTGDFQATLTWNTGNPNADNCVAGGRDQDAVDIDLHVIEPDGTRVYFDNRTGPTAQLDVDNQVAFGPENIYVLPGDAADGVYQVGVVFFCGRVVPTTATIRIKVFANTPQEQTFVFTRVLTVEDPATAINVANVTFPAGTVQEVTGSCQCPPLQQKTG